MLSFYNKEFHYIDCNIFLVPPMLDECIEFLESRCKKSNFNYEIIVVSDGSKDGTVSVANKYCKKLGTDKFRILELETNRGKGGAVRMVNMCFILFYFNLIITLGHAEC